MLKSINITALMGFLDLNIGTVKYFSIAFSGSLFITFLDSFNLGGIVFCQIMN